MPALHRTLITIATIVGFLLVVAPLPTAVAADPIATDILIKAAASAPPGTQTPVRVTLFERDARSALSGQTVHLHRRTPGGPDQVTDLVTDANGVVEVAVIVAETAEENRFFVVYDGSPTHAGTTSPTITIAAQREETTTQLTGPAAAKKTTEVDLVARVRAGGSGVGDALVIFERRRDGAWGRIGTAATDPTGRATHRVRVSVTRSENQFRARFPGAGARGPSISEVFVIDAQNFSPALRLTGPRRVTDEQSATLRIVWQTRAGAPVDATVQVHTRRRGTWRLHDTVALGGDGVASFTVRPRTDTRWRVVGGRGPWYNADTSRVRRLDNVPPLARIVFARAAPAPRVRVPVQGRAVGAGANPVVTRIGDAVWASMVGRSWHSGCPVGRSGLRLIRVNYWGYDGYRHRGELVVNARRAGTMARGVVALYNNRFRVRSMYRVDRFGWSSRLQGADDYASMAAGNTSAFNCRNVVGRPGVRSPHASGKALDLNPWENPYYSRADGWVPNAYWRTHTAGTLTWRSSSAPVVRVLRAAGLRWTYGNSDMHHFDA